MTSIIDQNGRRGDIGPETRLASWYCFGEKKGGGRCLQIVAGFATVREGLWCRWHKNQACAGDVWRLVWGLRSVDDGHSVQDVQ